MDDHLSSGADVSARTGIPERTLSDWRSRGLGPAYLKIGRHVRYRNADVERWLDTRVVKPGRPAA